MCPKPGVEPSPPTKLLQATRQQRSSVGEQILRADALSARDRRPGARAEAAPVPGGDRAGQGQVALGKERNTFGFKG